MLYTHIPRLFITESPRGQQNGSPSLLRIKQLGHDLIANFPSSTRWPSIAH